MLKIPVSIGELADKITILKIKLKFLKGQRKVNVKNEYDLLTEELRSSSIIIRDDLMADLQMTNQMLWESEDKIRVKELNNDFKEDFVELARTIYKLNDRRYEIKNKINKKYNSIIIEEKIYESQN